MNGMMARLFVGLFLVGFGGGILLSCDRHMQHEQPVSLRMFKYLDFVSAFDAVYMHAVAMDEIDALPEGFVRAWEAIKSGCEVVDLKDLIVALPILYDQFLLARSCAIPEDIEEDVQNFSISRLVDLERALVEVMLDFERRICLLEAAENTAH